MQSLTRLQVNSKILPRTKHSTTADETAGHAVPKEASTEHDQSCFSHRKVQEIQHSFRPALRHKGSMVVPVQTVCSLLVLDQALTGLYLPSEVSQSTCRRADQCSKVHRGLATQALGGATFEYCRVFSPSRPTLILSSGAASTGTWLTFVCCLLRLTPV